MIRTLTIIVLSIFIYATAPSPEVAEFFRLDRPAEVLGVNPIHTQVEKETIATAPLTQPEEKPAAQEAPPAPEPKPVKQEVCDPATQWVRADNGQCLDKPKGRPATVTAPASGGCEQYRPLLNQYDWDPRIMFAIMRAENRSCNPAINNYSAGENHGVCVGSHGLLQVGCVHFSGGQNPNNPSTNIDVAYRVWLKQGYRAWTMYQNGTYLQFL